MLGSVRNVARTLLAYADTRARLAASEVEEQVLRFAEIAVWAVFALFFFGAGLVFVAIVLVLLFWQSHPGVVAALVAAAFLGAGAFGAMMVNTRLRERPPFLADTLAEISKDRERMEKKPAPPPGETGNA